MDNIEAHEKKIAENKMLCYKFPFLAPSDDEEIKKWNYEYTKLDAMPSGWRQSFGEQMCEEILKELKTNNMVDNYHIMQIKEKYGSLRWYDNGFTQHGFDIISKYEKLSKRTCICCGKPATKVSTAWISPWCDDCADKVYDIMVPIDEYYTEVRDT